MPGYVVIRARVCVRARALRARRRRVERVFRAAADDKNENRQRRAQDRQSPPLPRRSGNIDPVGPRRARCATPRCHVAWRPRQRRLPRLRSVSFRRGGERGEHTHARARARHTRARLHTGRVRPTKYRLLGLLHCWRAGASTAGALAGGGGRRAGRLDGMKHRPTLKRAYGGPEFILVFVTDFCRIHIYRRNSAIRTPRKKTSFHVYLVLNNFPSACVITAIQSYNVSAMLIVVCITVLASDSLHLFR